MQRKVPYVGIIVPTGMKEVVQGVARFVYPEYRWRVKWFSGWGGTDLVKDVMGSGFDGMIVLEDRPGLAVAVAGCGLPTVKVLNSYATPGLPQVAVDETLVGEVAADYLLNRGFDNLAAFCSTDTVFARERGQAFVERVRANGKNCLASPRCQGTELQVLEELGEWLATLPKPVAVFCESDWRAKLCCDSCHLRSLRVPEDVAILGVDDDELLCQLTYPPLSSVIVPTRDIGYQAARVLDDLICGKPAPAQPVRLPPVGITTRASTDIMAIADPEIAAVMRFMREHFHHPIGVADILRHVPVARRTLEKKFRAMLYRSPLEELRRLRLEAAKLRLARGDMRIPEIAHGCGFADGRRFATVFRKQVGCTPGQYRRKYRTR